MRLYDQSVINQFSKAKEYHFLNMHIYINALFREDKVAEDKHAYHHYEVKPAYFSKEHHVHIFMWRLNTDLENMIGMFKFIGEVNKIVKRPVYIHIPKRIFHETEYMIGNFKTILDIIEYEGNKLRYDLIMEKNSNITEFQYGDYIPIPGQRYGATLFPNTSLIVSWDPHGYARPTFFSKRSNTSRSGFKEDKED